MLVEPVGPVQGPVFRREEAADEPRKKTAARRAQA